MSERLTNNEESYDSQKWSILSDLAKVPEQSKQRYGCYSPENAKNYIKDRFADNLIMLEQDVQDESYIELYKDIMEEYPILRTVILEDEDIDDNAYFYRASIQPDGTYAPKVACNLSHCETYAFDANENLEVISPMDSRLGTAYFIKRLAFAVGADWKKCAKNVRLNADATLLHELGHAYDFIENYLRPEYEKLNGDSRGAEALFRAVEAKDANRDEFRRRGPNPYGNWLVRNSSQWRKNERRLKAMGIDNFDEYKYAVHQYYRDMPDESYADQFAYNYIMKHYDKYFTTDKNERSSRIFVDENREIELDPDFVHILGLKQGLGVEINKLDENRRSEKHIKGFLALNMYVGKNVYLYENGDPKNPGEKWRICKGISEITLKPFRNEETGNIQHFVFFKDEEGAEYHISRTNEEAEIVDCSPYEMADELGLEVGDTVQLIEHLGDDARTIDSSNMDKPVDHIIEGKLLKIDGYDTDENIIISCQIGNKTTKLNYPARRKWKTWYVGNYEILPTPK